MTQDEFNPMRMLWKSCRWAAENGLRRHPDSSYLTPSSQIAWWWHAPASMIAVGALYVSENHLDSLTEDHANAQIPANAIRKIELLQPQLRSGERMPQDNCIVSIRTRRYNINWRFGKYRNAIQIGTCSSGKFCEFFYPHC